MESILENQELYEELVGTFKALANEDRLKILALLKENTEMSAQEVEQHFYLEQSTTSHHLNTLKRANLTKSRKQGRHIFYSLDNKNSKVSISKFLESFL